MTYKKKITKESPEFKPLIKMISHVRGGPYGDPIEPLDKEKLRYLIKEKYKITIQDYNIRNGYHPVDFGSKKNYVLCMLRWG